MTKTTIALAAVAMSAFAMEASANNWRTESPSAQNPHKSNLNMVFTGNKEFMSDHGVHASNQKSNEHRSRQANARDGYRAGMNDNCINPGYMDGEDLQKMRVKNPGWDVCYDVN